MEQDGLQGGDENHDDLKPAENIENEENNNTIVRSKVQNMLIQMAFLIAGILLFVFINYVFGFMKGN